MALGTAALPPIVVTVFPFRPKRFIGPSPSPPPSAAAVRPLIPPHTSSPFHICVLQWKCHRQMLFTKIPFRVAKKPKRMASSQPSWPNALPMLLLLLAFLGTICAQLRSVPIPLYMDQMLSAGRQVYDKQSTPTQNLGTPTNVKLAMYIEGIGSFRTHTMDFQLDVYLQQFWRDPRLAHNETSRILIRDKTILDRIWHPDVYFANARIAQFHEVTQPNFLVWIDPDGSILYDTRVSMIVICAMNLKNFPLDSQWCHLRILSYAYDIHHLQIEWIENEPITKNMNITMSDMDIVKLIPGSCDGNYSTGVWSCVTAEFFVSRELTHHILQTYVPTTLIVVISWFSFWLDVEAVPARVSLAITTLLTLSTQANSVKNSLPEVSYMKSLDLFLAVSVLFVFGVLIEFTIVNYTQRNATFIFDDRSAAEEQTTMAAAGLLDEKEGTPKCTCFSMLRKTFTRWFCHHKHLSMSEEKSWSVPEESQAKLSPIRLSLLRSLSQRKWSKSPEKGDCNSMNDLEAGHGMLIASDGNNNISQRDGLHNRRGSAKKLLAKERGGTPQCTAPQLQHVSSGTFNGRSRGSGGTVAPIIVYEEKDADERRSQPPQSVDKREAARLAYWARPELSYEGLALRANANSYNQQSSVEQFQPPMIVEPDDEPNRPPLAQQEGSSTSSTPPIKRATSSFISSSQDQLNAGVQKEDSSSLLPAGAAGPRPVSRRASAMASLLDPINIGCGGRRDSLLSTVGNVGSQGAGQSMTPQAKWRHAVRKLQMNKREAGRMQAKKIDAWSRWAFPLSYFSFHAAYWYYYLRVAA